MLTENACSSCLSHYNWLLLSNPRGGTTNTRDIQPSSSSSYHLYSDSGRRSATPYSSSLRDMYSKRDYDPPSNGQLDAQSTVSFYSLSSMTRVSMSDLHQQIILMLMQLLKYYVKVVFSFLITRKYESCQ